MLESDKGYIDRLDLLPEKERRALKFGDWDIFDGQYFSEFRRDIHVIEPFEIPETWRRFRTRDYGLDMCAVLWIAVDWNMNAYVYKELPQPDLIVSEAAKRINDLTNENIYCDYAPPDLWNRNRDTGKSAAEIFAENNQFLTKASNDRINGWLAVHEWLKIITDEQGIETSKLKIFSTCTNLIRTLPAVVHDKKNPNDVATEPHELTHLPDALRYFCIMHQLPSKRKIRLTGEYYTPTELEDLGYKDKTAIITKENKALSVRRRHK